MWLHEVWYDFLLNQVTVSFILLGARQHRYWHFVSIRSPTRNTAPDVEEALANDERPISEASKPFSPWIHFEVLNTSYKKNATWAILRCNRSCMRSTKHSLGAERWIRNLDHWDSLTTIMVQSPCSLHCCDKILVTSDNHHIRWSRRWRCRIGFCMERVWSDGAEVLA